MIHRLELTNFKSHIHTEMTLGRLTLLVGPNSSGKTSFLEALLLVCRTREGQQTQLRDPGALVRTGQDSSRVEFSSYVPSLQSKEFKVALDLDRVRLSPNLHFSYMGHTAAGSSKNLPVEARKFISALAQTVHLKLSPRRLAAPSYSEDIPPQLGNAGDGLASALANLMTYEPDRFETLMSLVKSVLPFVKAVRVRSAKVPLAREKVLAVDDKAYPIDTSLDVVGQEMVLDVDGARAVPAHAVSDGTLLTIGILTILASSNCPNLILLDDVEHGLHPRAQRLLLDVLKGILEERPELQIVMTTHSPYVVDEVDASDVWVLAANQEGATTARRLSDHPDAERALEVLTTGEFLDAEGEDWVLGDA